MIRNGQGRLRELDAAPVTIDETPAFIPLDAHRMQVAIDRRCAGDDHSISWDARVVGATASTNSDLLREAREGRLFDRPVILAAESQTAGRGRLGREWQSKPGASLTVSYAVRVRRRLAELEGISLVCGLALRDALGLHGLQVDLKWPNDVLVDGRKLAGILVEAHALATSTVVIVGVGINLLPLAFEEGFNETSDGTRAIVAIDLHSTGCRLEDRNVLAAELAVALQKRLARLAERGFREFMAEWNAADAFRDRRVSFGTTADKAIRDTVCGIERGVDAGGGLLIEIDGRQQRFIAGDLSLRAIGAA